MGYGFLLECEVFLKVLVEVGIVFIGLNFGVIVVMGDKIELKKVVAVVKVLIVLGYFGVIEGLE